MIQITGDKEILKVMDTLDKDLHRGIKELNRKRAKQFDKFLKNPATQVSLGLKKISKATIKMQGGNHPPLYNKGHFINSSKTTISGSSYDVGWMRNNRSKPEKGNLTWFQIASIHEAGYRIPLQGIKGERVRRFLAAHGIFVKKSKKFLTVPPRPLLDKAIRLYDKKNIDDKIIEKHMAQLYSKL